MIIAKFKWITEENGDIPADKLAGLSNNLFNNKADAVTWIINAGEYWTQIGYNDIFVLRETYSNV